MPQGSIAALKGGALIRWVRAGRHCAIIGPEFLGEATIRRRPVDQAQSQGYGRIQQTRHALRFWGRLGAIDRG